jgi:hypothetical protein
VRRAIESRAPRPRDPADLRRHAARTTASVLRALFAVAALAAPVAADPITVDSVEAATVDADLVVRGTITRAERLTRADRPGFSWFDVTMIVHETLKGRRQPTVRFAVREVFCRTWATGPSDVVVFLVETRRRGDADTEVGHPGFAGWAYAPRDHALFPALDRIDLGAPIAIHDRAFRVLDKPRAVLAAIRGAAHIRARYVHFLEAPHGTPSHRALRTGAPLEKILVAVPVDAVLERLALRWLDDRDSLLQFQGVRAIGAFPKHRARVLRLVADPRTESFVRERAQRVLDEEWGPVPP